MSPLDQRQGQLPDQVTMGLLQYLNEHTLDEDYALAAERRAAGHREGPAATRRNGVLAGLVLAGFGALAVTAGLATSAGAGDDAGDRRQLIEQVSQRRAENAEDRRQIASLQQQTEELEQRLFAGGNSEVFDHYQLLALRNGSIATVGPGVLIKVDDASGAADDRRRRVLDTDLQHVANGLWEAGAEAMSINGERLSNLSAIRHAGDAITVNFHPISPPYEVLAIGDPDALPARFGDTTSGQTWLDLQREIGLRFNMKVVDELVLPAAPDRELRFAETPDSDKLGVTR